MITEEEVGVLIVDDETEVTDLYEGWLSAYRTYTVHDGEEAITFLDRNADRIDVVLLDRKMPGLNGGAVLEAIRDHGHDCPVAMITAVAPDYDIIDMAFDEYVTKPVDGERLRTTVKELLSRAQYADGLALFFARFDAREPRRRTSARRTSRKRGVRRTRSRTGHGSRHDRQRRRFRRPSRISASPPRNRITV